LVGVDEAVLHTIAKPKYLINYEDMGAFFDIIVCSGTSADGDSFFIGKFAQEGRNATDLASIIIGIKLAPRQQVLVWLSISHSPTCWILRDVLVPVRASTVH